MSYIIKYIDGTEEIKKINSRADLRFLIEKLHIIGYKKL